MLRPGIYSKNMPEASKGWKLSPPNFSDRISNIVYNFSQQLLRKWGIYPNLKYLKEIENH